MQWFWNVLKKDNNKMKIDNSGVTYATVSGMTEVNNAQSEIAKTKHLCIRKTISKRTKFFLRNCVGKSEGY